MRFERRHDKEQQDAVTMYTQRGIRGEARGGTHDWKVRMRPGK